MGEKILLLNTSSVAIESEIFWDIASKIFWDIDCHRQRLNRLQNGLWWKLWLKENLKGWVWVFFFGVMVFPLRTMTKWGIRNRTIQNPETLEIRTFKNIFWMVHLSQAIALDTTIQKPVHSTCKHFCPDFKWFMTKLWLFVWILKCWAARFQVFFKIEPIWKPTL